MEVTYTLTPQDKWAFRQFQARRKPVLRIVSDLSGILLAVTWLGLVGVTVRQLLVWLHVFGRSPFFWQFYLSVHHRSLSLLLLYTLFVAYSFWGTRLLFLSQVRGTRMGLETITAYLYADALLVTTPREHNRVAWASIREIVDAPKYLYFYISPAAAIIVPKRVFGIGAAAASAFEATARAFKSDTQATLTTPAPAEVWPPPPVRRDALLAPAAPEDPDPPGTTEITYVTRRADALRSTVYTLLTQPSVTLGVILPLLLPSLFVAFATRAGNMGYVLAVGLTLLVTALLIGNHVRLNLRARFSDRDAVRECISKIRPDAFVDISPNGRVVVPWRDIGTITLVWGDLHLRRRNGRGAYFIPRSAFASPSDARAALELMRCRQREAGYTQVSNDEVLPTQ